ncbi:ABC transporter permease [Azospirillum sp. RWY-5-1]|uniref:ABC transporter permease n=1 Tax=Azospirillum oleiclasticum TaxID=2735135 RepID=A0ABX2TKC2_9PROT|nr:ABC transporter permease [Azospirillum oleiclasticum]NYZ15904.1 ABC transporter permease [Azospirillum oleiclasticum]NYZ23617.1 ABC transporter permease [Azospirillum oleiclasticum]
MDGFFAPLKPVGPGLRLALGIACFALFFLGWGIATYGGFVRPLFLASPGETLASGWALFVEYGFARDVLITVGRVVGGFLLAAVLAVPLGILMGAFKPVDAFFQGFMSFARYLPASAFIPLLILWAGVGELQKVLVIFIGSVFQLVIMVGVIVGSVRMDLLEAAYTLGASRRGVVLRVLLPAAAPQIFEALRLVLGWAWTYVIVAELVGASRGIGHMIIEAQRFLDTGQMIFGIFIIGLIGLITDFLFQAGNARLFPWTRGR